MIGLVVGVLLAAASVLCFCLPPVRWHPAVPHGAPASGQPLTGTRRVHPDADAPALLVRELAGLLAAGRSAQQIWADAAALYSATDPRGHFLHPFAPVLQGAAAATALGHSPAPILAAAGGPGITGTAVAEGKGGGAAGYGRGLLPGLWAGLAVCVQVSERSGAPLATVLSRYAGQLDAEREAAADRAAALAGPRATVRLLTWLPAGGIVLGYMLGGNPLQVLLTTPLGWAAGAAGAGFWLAGRIWSRRLVAAAGQPPGPAIQ